MALKEAFFNMGDHGIKEKHAYKLKRKAIKHKKLLETIKIYVPQGFASQFGCLVGFESLCANLFGLLPLPRNKIKY